ncbi:MAG: MBL fold metallo-hydrolase [Nanoarchaeota archaeon]|nr:MBL fold metallo-hydrolase [Nanoarchaeota archaeon]
MRKPIVEILLKNKNKIILVRILSRFDAVIKKYPQFGIWTYLLNSTDGIYVFDPGPRFYGLTTAARKNQKKTGNADIIMMVADDLFPDKSIKEIWISHYHYDHSEAGPELQEFVKDKSEKTPPIRAHANDYGKKKLMKIFNDSLEITFKKAGYKEWKIGVPIKDNEPVGDTGFKCVHAPGHTSGNIALVNDDEKIAITGWWVLEDYGKVAEFLQTCFIDEDKKHLKSTIKKFRGKDYKFYFYHPLFKLNHKKQKK